MQDDDVTNDNFVSDSDLLYIILLRSSVHDMEVLVALNLK